ncbi:hypothetical protein BDZ97DRAFT_1766291 [Flammula alnicola]|nr:hypothetical protein BDZ97DRAFT_1766291 [Flammula alnicola]
MVIILQLIPLDKSHPPVPQSPALLGVYRRWKLAKDKSILTNVLRGDASTYQILSAPILRKDLTASGHRHASDIWNLGWALGDVMLEQTIVNIVSGNNTVLEEQVEHFLEKVTNIFPHFAIQYDHCKALPLAELLLHCSGNESPAHDKWDFTRSTIKNNIFVNYICGQLLDLLEQFRANFFCKMRIASFDVLKYFPVLDHFVPAWMDFFDINTTAELGYSIMQALAIPLPETIGGTVIIHNDHIPSKQLLTCTATVALLNKMVNIFGAEEFSFFLSHRQLGHGLDIPKVIITLPAAFITFAVIFMMQAKSRRGIDAILLPCLDELLSEEKRIWQIYRVNILPQIRVADSDLNVSLANLCRDLETGNFMNDIAHMGIEQCRRHLHNI